MYKKIILFLWINLLWIVKVFALPIGFILLWWESLLFIWATLSTIFFSIFFYFKKLSFLNKIILFLSITFVISIWYLSISEKVYNQSNNLDQNNTPTNNNYLP